MIGSLRGTLLHKSPPNVLVEVGGVGYRVTVPVNTLSSFPPEGHEVFLFVHTHVREDAIQLYGFTTETEKRTFLTLLTITGIGPKVALSIVSTIPHDQFLSAVDAEDITLLTRVPGLGKKTAQRIVLELRGKLATEAAPTDAVFTDALSALTNLGYKKAEATAAIEAVRGAGADGLEATLRDALKHLNVD